MLAILHSPPPELDRKIGVVVVVGGAQYRVGSHRMFVSLARNLAAAGCSVLRFDRRGTGDSWGEDPGFEDCNEDIQAAVSGLKDAVPGLQEIHLMGLCDGATAAAICYFPDDEISGYVMINPWIRSPQTQARVLLDHYYKSRFMDRDFWRELFAGKVHLLQSIKEYINFWRNSRSHGFVMPSLQSEIFYRLKRVNKPVLFALSENDITGQEFLVGARVVSWKDWLQNDPRVTLVQFENADHTFSIPASLDKLASVCRDWLINSKKS
ncbi:MAG: hydrolase 1, exosortase A system-associated [Gammaproteobacteria bacterium]|nr:hydrolase 1, exosortase A system-associated [Gammaproteobacteria bacterium]